MRKKLHSLSNHLPFHQSLATLAQFLVQCKNRYQLDQYDQLILQLYLEGHLDPDPTAPTSKTWLRQNKEKMYIVILYKYS